MTKKQAPEPLNDSVAEPKKPAKKKKPTSAVARKRPTITDAKLAKAQEAAETLNAANDILNAALVMVVVETLGDAIVVPPTVARLAALKTNEPKEYRAFLKRAGEKMIAEKATTPEMAEAWPFIAKAVTDKIEKRLDEAVDAHIAKIVGDRVGYIKPPEPRPVPSLADSVEQAARGPVTPRGLRPSDFGPSMPQIGDLFSQVLRQSLAGSGRNPWVDLPVIPDPPVVARPVSSSSSPGVVKATHEGVEALRKAAGLPPGVLIVVELTECSR